MKRFVLIAAIIFVWSGSVPNVYGQKGKVKMPGKAAKKEDKKPAGQFKVGDVAEGLETDGTWYKVDILKVETGKYFIHWQGFQDQYDRWIEAEKTRAIAGGSSGSATSTGSGASGSTASGSSGGAAAVSGSSGSSSSVSTDDTPFKVGDKVDVLGRSMWLEATVLEVKLDPLAPRRNNHSYRIKRGTKRGQTER